MADVELSRGAAALAVADLPAVHVEVEGGIDAGKMNQGAALVPVHRQVEAVTVAPHWIELPGGPGRIDREGVFDVGVDRNAMTVGLPVRGHRDRAPRGVVKIALVEIKRT